MRYPSRHPRRPDTNRYVIVHRLAHHLANSAPNARFRYNHQLHRLKIHLQRMPRTFGDTGMAALSCGTEPMGDHRRTHPHIGHTADGLQSPCRAGCNTGQVLAQQARRTVREEHRRPVLFVEADRTRWTGFDAIAAYCAALQKDRLRNSAGRAQPIDANRCRSRWSNCIGLFGKFECSLRHRAGRIRDELASSICGISGHNEEGLGSGSG